MKVIYNVTVNIDQEIAQEWLNWMRHTHIPDVMRTGSFLSYKVLKVQALQEDETGETYAIQYICPSAEHLKNYQQQYAPALQAEHNKRYNGKFAAFRTILDILDEG
ncbi:MAG: DUF4286 family protein [Cytophagales bacterium]|nr:MAG: DUF4286 family protein [Cytophagales bacterium]TAF61548.1 MAG: DUF4286 family protein [Cytophagales bacterium]